ncbi:unnamed protein product [Meloidogyne enterolobii]|uniref:Uncharacterized protein n=1 Tax=Meloidogyne enterolobii TaxID=390850 RepID=A0ACB1B3N0_MELEN
MNRRTFLFLSVIFALREWSPLPQYHLFIWPILYPFKERARTKWSSPTIYPSFISFLLFCFLALTPSTSIHLNIIFWQLCFSIRILGNLAALIERKNEDKSFFCYRQ